MTLAHLLKIIKYKLKFISKPWITAGSQNSIWFKNRFLALISLNTSSLPKNVSLNLLSILLKKINKCIINRISSQIRIMLKVHENVLNHWDKITPSVPRINCQGEKQLLNLMLLLTSSINIFLLLRKPVPDLF